jgi:hypothetical protein
VKLCVGPGAALPACAGGELATVAVNAFNSALLSASDLRGLNINRAIQNGLRYLWQSQTGRATNFPTVVTTSWPSSYPRVAAALIVLAFENHQYLLPNNDSAPTGVYEKYVVRRGLNFVIDQLRQQSLNVQTAGTPCVGPGIEAAPCVGLIASADTNNTGYETPIAALPLAGSTALNRHVAEITGSQNAGFVVGKTYGEVLQRTMNTIAWGQNDAGCVGRGGWIYTFSNNTCQQDDGSTLGWDILALLDAGAAGTTIPAFVKFELSNFAVPEGSNTDGTLDYRSDNNPAVATSLGKNLARAGTGLSALFFAGHVGVGDAQVSAGRDAVNSRWLLSPGTDYVGTCGTAATNNKGCSYAMFNVFKGLKLQSINSLAAAPDWYGEYQDFLVSTETSPTTTTGGNWGSMDWSCCDSTMGTAGNSAIAELILAPVSLVQPDPTLFSTVGLTPFTATNPVGTDHTVTAFVQSATNTPIAGATVGFTVLAGGPNAGASGTCAPVGCVSGADGKVSFTYHDTNGAGHDTIRANIGTLLSNIVDKFWANSSIKCDANADGFVTVADLLLIRNANGQIASGPTDPRDGNSDGVINVLDARYCQLRLTQ